MNLAFMKRNAVCALLMLGIIAAWYLVGIRNSVSFWYSDDDYAYLSLSHALSFEQWLRGDPEINDQALGHHPGIPFYLTSWLALKIALPHSAQNFMELLKAESEAVERFWLVSRGIALLLTLGGVVLIFRAAAGKFSVVAAAAATILFLAMSDQPWVAMSRLGIESFTLPYAVLFYLAARNAFFDQRRSLIGWLIFGLVGGLGYSLKFHYVAFALGSAAGLMAMVASRSCRLSEATKLGTAYVVGFALSFGTLALAILGRGGILGLLRFHFGIATHSGYYGAGEADVVSSAQLQTAINALSYMPALIAVLLLIVAGAMYAMLIRWPERDWRGSGFPLGLALLVALLLSFAAVLKHFQPHYLVVPVSIVPLLLLYVADYAVPRLASGIFIVFTGALGVYWLSSTLLHFDLVQRGYLQTETRLREDVAAIEARPLGPSEFRIWEYRVPAPGFAVGFVVQYAGSRTISEWYREEDLRDHTAQFVPRKPWRYAILRKGPSTTVVDIRKWPEYKAGDRIELLKETATIERLSKNTP